MDPHRDLLDEILLRLFQLQATEGWTCTPHGEPWTDA
jgi:hypothetical protein